MLGSLGSVGVGWGVSQQRAAEEGLFKTTTTSQVGEYSREREGQERSVIKAGGPSYRHDPGRVVPVRNPLKHPELHSLIDRVTHLGGWRHEGWLCCTIKGFLCLIICSIHTAVHSDRQLDETWMYCYCLSKTSPFPCDADVFDCSVFSVRLASSLLSHILAFFNAWLSHHGQLSLQLLDAVLLEVELGAQHPRVLRGFLGLPPQVPLLPLQQVLLFGQRLHRILALLGDTEILMDWFTYQAHVWKMSRVRQTC